MPTETREVRPAPRPRTVLCPQGGVLTVPDDWSLLPPGDAALSRRVKMSGPSWTVIELRGNKRFSQGIWADTARIERLRGELAIERKNPAYQQKLAAGRRRRAEEQAEYEREFHAAVVTFLNFHRVHLMHADHMARLITKHAVPVGSGTVARTERIPLAARAEAATIAWMRHQTTGYDQMVIPLVKGKRREVRRMLAQRSVELLGKYRRGEVIDRKTCALAQALDAAR